MQRTPGADYEDGKLVPPVALPRRAALLAHLPTGFCARPVAPDELRSCGVRGQNYRSTTALI